MTTENDEDGPQVHSRPVEGSAEKAEREAREALEAMNVLGDVWRPLGEWPDTRPPARKWLVVRPEEDDKSSGVLPLGKVGLLAGAGAAGKSWLTTQLAVAVAAGASWVGLEVATPGRVLLILGEEEAEEAKRRLHYAGAMMDLSREQKKRAEQNLVVLPMAGRDVALTMSLEDTKAGELPETALLHELRRRLTVDGPWSLVVLDPLARFAGADVETDNAAATRFVQVLEQLVKAGAAVRWADDILTQVEPHAPSAP